MNNLEMIGHDTIQDQNSANILYYIDIHRCKCLISTSIHKLNPALTGFLISIFVYISMTVIFEVPFSSPFYEIHSNSSIQLGENLRLIQCTFSIFFLLIFSLIIGYIAQLVHLPALLGILLVGIVFRNTSGTQLALFIDKNWSSTLRRISFVIILVQGGLSLDGGALRRLKGVCFRLASFPCIFEAISVMFISRWLLELNWQYGLMLGFALGAVSPAICVPAMVELSNQGYGLQAGIPTLIIAASSIDDVLAITAFSVIVAITFSQNSILSTILLRTPMEVLGSGLSGIFVGFLCWNFPLDSVANNRTFLRLCLLLSGATTCMFIFGPIGCLFAGFVAAFRWKKLGKQSEEEAALSLMWEAIFQPLLFALIGVELDLSKIGMNRVWLGFLSLFFGLIIRTIVAFFATFGAKFRYLERLFIAFAWLPKATVQAALGPVAYDISVRKNLDSKQKHDGITVLTIAVLSIIVTAPIGAIFMKLAGPYLLKRKHEMQKVSEDLTDLAVEFHSFPVPFIDNDSDNVKNG